MILLVHIVAAFASIGLSAFVYISPTKYRLLFSYVSVGITLVSGVILVVSKPSHLMQACAIGSIYFAVVSYLTASARNKLSRI